MGQLTPEQEDGRDDTDGETDTGVDDKVSDLSEPARGKLDHSLRTRRSDTYTCVKLRQKQAQ